MAAPARRCIRFSEGYVELIRTGRKRITFRAGRRRFVPGEIVEGKCAEGVVLLLRITGCESKPLREVTEGEARADICSRAGKLSWTACASSIRR